MKEIKYFKKASLVLILICVSFYGYAQKDLAPKATKEANAGRFYAAGVEAQKSAEEYVKNAKELSLPNLNYPKALECYVRSAEYFQKVEKKWGKAVTEQKNGGIAKAEEILALCKSKNYRIPSNLEMRLKQLKGEKEDEKNSNDKKEIGKDEEDGDLMSGAKTVYFKTSGGIFSIKLPSPLKAVGPFGSVYKTYDMKGLGKDVEKIMDAIGSGTQMNSFDLKGYQVGVGFKAYPKTTIMGKLESSREGKVHTKNDRTYRIGSESVTIGGNKGKLNFHSEWEIDNPNQSKEDIMSTFETRFSSKTHVYIFTVGVRNLDDLKVYKKVEAMVRSLKAVQKVKETKEEVLCKGNDEKFLGEKSMKVVWRIPHPTKRPFFIQRPFLARDKVPGAWTSVSNALINAMKLKKSTAKNIKIVKQAYDGKYISAAVKRIGWAAEYTMGVEFIPIDFSQLKGGLSNAVIFYLQALKSSSVGIAKAGDRATSMSMDIYWEIPYIEIHALCIPRMICKNGEWVPDYSKPVFRELHRIETNLHSSVKQNLSMRGVHNEMEKVYLEEIKKMEHSEMMYREGNKCKDCMAEFYNIKWPGELDMCDYFKGKIKNTKEQIRFSEEEKKRRELEKQKWDKEKPLQLKELNEEITAFEKAIKDAEAEITAKEKKQASTRDIKKQHEINSGKDSEIYKEYVEKEKQLIEEIGRVGKQRLNYVWIRDDKVNERIRINSGTIDNEKKTRIQEMDQQIVLQKKQLQSLKKTSKQYCQ